MGGGSTRLLAITANSSGALIVLKIESMKWLHRNRFELSRVFVPMHSLPRDSITFSVMLAFSANSAALSWTRLSSAFYS